MKNTFGNNVALTLFGESHGEMIGAVLDGMGAGIKVDPEFIRGQMELRKSLPEISTARQESDEVRMVSGVYNGFTTGTPITFLIENKNARSGDYDSLENLARPGHADYTGSIKYHGFQDPRGGGHFSGRLTAGLVAAGAVCISALREKGIFIGTHLEKLGDVSDRKFSFDETLLLKEIQELSEKSFSVLDSEASEKMKEKILKAKEEGDSVGGILETCITGFPSGIGEPFFDSIESSVSHILFSIPGVKGVSFGDGFELAEMKGSEANDRMYMENKNVAFATNHQGGIFGGISGGTMIRLHVAVKPTPSIGKKQDTIDYVKLENKEIEITGRHDPCIAHRARVVVDSAVAIALCDLLTCRFGTEYWNNSQGK